MYVYDIDILIYLFYIQPNKYPYSDVIEYTHT